MVVFGLKARFIARSMTRNGSYVRITSFQTRLKPTKSVCFMLFLNCSLIKAIRSLQTIPYSKGKQPEVHLYKIVLTDNLTGEKLCLPLVVCAAEMREDAPHTLNYQQKSHTTSDVMHIFHLLFPDENQVCHEIVSSNGFCIATTVHSAVYCSTRNTSWSKAPIAAFECVHAVIHTRADGRGSTAGI